jgi:hypothetical protein
LRPCFLLFAILLLVPLASAGPVTDGCTDGVGASVCTWEHAYQDGTCSLENDAYSYSATRARVYTDAARAEFEGTANCASYINYWAYWDSAIILNADAAGQEAGVAWSRFDSERPSGETSFCYLSVFVGDIGQGTTDCTVPAPPNPGWGHLLP